MDLFLKVCGISYDDINKSEVLALDISTINNQVNVGSAYTTQSPPDTQAVVSNSLANIDNNGKPTTDSANNQNAKKQVDPQNVKKMTEAMNQFMESMNSTIRFKIHEKTNELMVQVVDQTNNKVLKEFPPHEFLDTIAAIRSYVGMLLDKKI
ncbi:flagellar protein FlaG [Desulfosporosinus sp. SB140]|uniref:flagellar protein FlaG n=1 Tax=Desulfosporosinus paludis TaxID=3115649 RepID=UPI00388D2A7C